MFGRIKLAIDWNRLGLKISKVGDAIEKERRMDPQYDWKIGAWKAVKALGFALLVMALNSLGDEQWLAATLGDTLGPGLKMAVVGAIAAFVKFVHNRRKFQ